MKGFSRLRPGRQGGRRGTGGLRLFFATDIHGSDRCFRKFLAAAQIYEATVLILGGDIVGKALVPIVTRGTDSVAFPPSGEVHVPVEREGVLREAFQSKGLYPVDVGEAELMRMQEDPRYVEMRLATEMHGQVQAWCQLVADRLPPGVRCIITPGNDDPRSLDPILLAAERVECPEGAVLDLGCVRLASLGVVTPTPWNTEREGSEPELASCIDAIMSSARTDAAYVFNFHCPPYGSGLDLAPELDETLKPVVRAGHVSQIPVGSHAVREAIERYRPTVALHGHIHESRGVQRIGQTVCLNPGSDYTDDVLVGAIVDLDDRGKYVDFLFTSG